MTKPLLFALCRILLFTARAVAVLLAVTIIIVMSIAITVEHIDYSAAPELFTGWQVPLVHSIYALVIAAICLLLWKRQCALALALALCLALCCSRAHEYLADFQMLYDMEICADTGYCRVGSRPGIDEASCPPDGTWVEADQACDYRHDEAPE
ncbi:hypothetical protein FACS1894186_6030 [Alphaproteobacteria bacterium]|nr:hypothetical protein FACS1894186_6030 [Alphaproteobacteria bacterium]